jgi:hypothetical protein
MILKVVEALLSVGIFVVLMFCSAGFAILLRAIALNKGKVAAGSKIKNARRKRKR